MNKGQFCLSMGKSDKSIWQLALIVSLKIERKRGKNLITFFMYLYVHFCARHILGTTGPQTHHTIHMFMVHQVCHWLAFSAQKKNSFEERLFSPLQLLGINIYYQHLLTTRYFYHPYMYFLKIKILNGNFFKCNTMLFLFARRKSFSHTFLIRRQFINAM